MAPTAEAEAPTTRATNPIRIEKFDRLPIGRIHPSKTNPRTHFDDAYIKDDLALSIADKGIIEPLVVRPHPKKDDDVEIVAGECRWRAAKIAGLELLPVIIREYSDEDVLEIQIEENTHRKDLTPLEEGAAYRRLITMNPDKHSAATIAVRIGKSVTYVWDYLKLLDLIPEAKVILERQLMSVGHAILIARLKPEDQQRAVATKDSLGYGPGIHGLWRDDSGRLDITSVDDEDADERAEKTDKYHSLKACSVRELETWIRNHVRLDIEHAAKAQPLVFEEIALQVKAVAEQPGRGKKVIPITHEYRVADDARDEAERTYGSDSWKRADGKEKSKTCEHAVLGVVIAGRGKGQTLQVCVNRDKCLVHFAQVVKQKQKTAALRDQGKTKQADKAQATAAQKEATRQKVEQAKREAAAAVWKSEADALWDGVVSQLKGVKTLTAAQATSLLEGGFDQGWGYHVNTKKKLVAALGAKWFTKLPAALLILEADNAFEMNDSYEDFVSGLKGLGLNLKPLQAIHEKAQQKAAAAPAKKGATA